MLSSIHPFGERARQQRYGTTASAFLLGSAIGGIVLGAVLAAFAAAVGVLGSLPYVAMAVLVVAALWELLRLPVPSIARQVNEDWLTRYRGWVYGIGFGVQLGVGFATYVKSSLTYGVALAAVLYGSPSVALLAGAVFGLVRGLSIFLTRRVETPGRLREMFSQIGQTQRRMQILGSAGVAAFALIGLGGLL